MSVEHPIPELRISQNVTLKIKDQGHWWSHSSKSQCGSSILSTRIPFIPFQSALPFQRCSTFKILTMMLHKCRSRQFLRTSNGTNPASGFRDMGSVKSGISAALFDKFLAVGQAHMGQITSTLHNYRSRQVHDTLNGINPSSGFRDICSTKSEPNLCQICFWPMGKPIWGNGTNDHGSAQLQA